MERQNRIYSVSVLVNQDIDLGWVETCSDFIGKYIQRIEKEEVIATLVDENLLLDGIELNNVHMSIKNDPTGELESHQVGISNQINGVVNGVLMMEGYSRQN